MARSVSLSAPRKNWTMPKANKIKAPRAKRVIRGSTICVVNLSTNAEKGFIGNNYTRSPRSCAGFWYKMLTSEECESLETAE